MRVRSVLARVVSPRAARSVPVQVLALLALLCAPEVASAQVVTPSERVITGSVIDSVSGRPVKGADLYFTTRSVAQRSAGEGRFRMDHVGPDDSILVVRSIGYVPAYVRIQSSTESAIDLGTVRIAPIATRLDRIAVEAEEIRLYPHLADFYRRKQQGLGGDYFTREQIQRAAVRKTSQLLYQSSKLEMACPSDPVRSGDNGCLPLDRRGRGYKVTQGDSRRCAKEIFVDGKLSMLEVDEVPVDDIAAIEVYAGPATTPGVFGQRRCGVVAIWTTGAYGR